MASTEHPFYEAIPVHPLRPDGLQMIMWSEGWRTGILASDVRKQDAAWLISLIQGKPRPSAGRS